MNTTSDLTGRPQIKKKLIMETRKNDPSFAFMSRSDKSSSRSESLGQQRSVEHHRHLVDVVPHQEPHLPQDEEVNTVTVKAGHQKQ